MKSNRARLIELCEDFLGGRKGVIETSREMMRWRHSIGPENDPDFIIFVAIESETDHLPVGSVRSYWSEKALLEKDREIRRMETFYRGYAEAAAKNLIEKHKHILDAESEET